MGNQINNPNGRQGKKERERNADWIGVGVAFQRRES